MTAASHRQMAAVDPDRTEVDYDDHHKYNKVHVRLYCLHLNDFLIIHIQLVLMFNRVRI